MSALRNTDRVLAWAGWIVAGLLVLMLFIGPQIVAEDEPGTDAPAYSGDQGGDGGDSGGGATTAAADGQQLFVDNCGSCHTLGAAGTTGSIGPSLDGAGLSADGVSAIVSSGSGTMPSFGDSLDQAQIDAIAQYVAGASQ